MIDFSTYDGDFAILTSDRLVFNSKKESVYIISKKTIGFSAEEQIHFNVGPSKSTEADKYYLIINAPRVQLGIPSQGANESVAKAESTIGFINDLISILSTFANTIKTATAVGVGVSKIPEISIGASLTIMQLQTLKNKYGLDSSPIKSKITKTI